MSNQEYERVVSQLKPALMRMAEDEVFREAFEANPLQELRRLDITLTSDLAEAMKGKTFSAFWSEHRTKSEERVQIRDLPPTPLSESELGIVVGGATFSRAISDSDMIARFAPPYVPIGPSNSLKTKG